MSLTETLGKEKSEHKHLERHIHRALFDPSWRKLKRPDFDNSFLDHIYLRLIINTISGTVVGM